MSKFYKTYDGFKDNDQEFLAEKDDELSERLLTRIYGFNSLWISLLYMVLFFVCLLAIYKEQNGLMILILLGLIAFIFFKTYSYCKYVYEKYDDKENFEYFKSKLVEHMEGFQKDTFQFHQKISDAEKRIKNEDIDFLISNLNLVLTDRVEMTEEEENKLTDLVQNIDKYLMDWGNESIFRTNDVLPDIQRINQIDTVMKTYSAKIKAVENDNSLSDDEREDLLNKWKMLRDDQIDSLM